MVSIDSKVVRFHYLWTLITVLLSAITVTAQSDTGIITEHFGTTSIAVLGIITFTYLIRKKRKKDQLNESI